MHYRRRFFAALRSSVESRSRKMVSAFVSITVQSKSSTSSVPSVAAGTIFNWEYGGDVQNCENPHSKRGRNIECYDFPLGRIGQTGQASRVITRRRLSCCPSRCTTTIPWHSQRSPAFRIWQSPAQRHSLHAKRDTLLRRCCNQPRRNRGGCVSLAP